MKPLFRYIKNIFASKRILADDSALHGLTRADHLLGQLVTNHLVPGLAITVLQKGDIIFEKGYGYAQLKEKKPIDPRKTLMRIASASKPIAATALVKSVEQNKIELDSSFYNYVPYFPKKEYDFTIRQLAGHTAGIRGYKGKEFALNRNFNIRESLQLFQDDALLFEPGTGFLYNSYDWVLISLAIQEVTGIEFADYVHANVLAPLNLEHIMPEDPNGEQPNQASFYTKTSMGFREAIPVDNRYKLAGGGYLATSSDLASFGQVYLNNDITTKSLSTQFLSSQKIKGEPTYYGLGWEASMDKKGRPYYGHVGNGVGGYSNFFVYPNEEMVVSIIINCTNPNVQETLDEAIDSLHLINENKHDV